MGLPVCDSLNFLRKPFLQSEMCSGNMLDSLLINASAAAAHMFTFPKLGMIPNFGLFGGMMGMGGGLPNTGFEIYKDPSYAAAQCIWNWRSGGSGFFGGGSIFPGFNAYNPMNPWGLSLGNTTSSTRDTRTEDEKRADKDQYKDKTEALKDFLSALRDNGAITTLTASQKARLKSVLDDWSTFKTWKEKYDALNGIYREISPARIQEFLVKSSGFAEEFAKIGYPGVNSDDTGITDNDVLTVHRGLQNIGNDNPNTEQTINILGNSETVIEAISKYNSTYPANGEDSLMKLLFKGIKKTDQAIKGTAINGLVTLCTNLKTKADAIADDANLDDATRTAIRTAGRELYNLINDDSKITGSKETNITGAYNKLYVLTRIASAKLLEQRINQEYEIFAENMGSFIMNQTASDLANEGLGGLYNTLINNVRLEGSSGSGSNENVTVTPDIDDLTDNSKVIEAFGDTVTRNTETFTEESTIPLGGKTYTIPAGTVIYDISTEYDSASNGTKVHHYIMTDDHKFIEVVKDGTTWKFASDAKLIKPSELKEMAETAAGSVKSAEQIAEESLNRINGVGEDLGSGKKFYRELVDNTSIRNGEPDVVYANINTTLQNINKDNVLTFMNEYYQELIGTSLRRQNQYNNGNIHEGIMERMDDERDGGGIKMENKLQLVNSFMDMIIAEKDPELIESQEFKHIHRIYKAYTEGNSTERVTFNSTCDNTDWWGWWRHSFGRFFGDKVWNNAFDVNNRSIVRTEEHRDRHRRYYDNETLDYCMIELLKKVNAKRARQAHQ